MSNAEAQNPVQPEFVAQHLRLNDHPVSVEVARKIGILVLDTFSIGRYARAAAIGATSCDHGIAKTAGTAPVWGGGESDAAGAAFLNGTAAEALDFQEVLIDGRNNGHAAVVIVPALLALAAERSVPMDRTLAALRTAFVANVALARALGRGHRSGTPGFRTTALASPVAAALGCALICEATPAQASHAVSIASTTLPAGLLAAMSPISGDFSVDKDISVGLSARHAVDCAKLALAGATGPADSLAGPRGWLASYGFGGEDIRPLTAAPSEAVIRQYALKLYPANFGCQNGIRLALEMAHQVPLDEIAAINIRVKESSAASLSARQIQSHVAARFSLAYSVASALVRRRSVLADFEGEGLSDPAVLAVMDRISIDGDEGFEARHQAEGVFPARLTVTRTGGEIVSKSLDAPQDGMSPEELDAAFDRKIRSLCPETEASALLALLRAGDHAGLVDAVTKGTYTRPTGEE